MGLSVITSSQSQSYYSLAPAAPARQGVVPSASQAPVQGSLTFTGGEKAVTQQFRPARRNVPGVDMTLNSPLNALNVQDVAAALEGGRHGTAFDYKLQFGSRFLAEQGRQLGNIYSTLLALRANAGGIQNSSAYNIKKAQSPDSAVVTAMAEQNAPVGGYAVTVTRLARREQLASTPATDPGAALGLSGTFKLNGWQSTVAPSDSLISIRDKINYGEDANHNGKLDYPADVNGDGTLQTFTAPGTWDGRQYISSFYLNENLVGQGSLSPNEDTNGNGRLDGVPAQTGVFATVAGGQLVLESMNGGNIDLRMEDPNRILETLGFISRNPENNATAPNFLNAQSAPPLTSEFSVNGHANTAASNVVTNGVGGLTLTLNGTGSATVNVTADPAAAITPITAFSDSFNQALDLLNTTIYSGGVLAGNTRLQDIYTDTVRSFFTPPPDAAGGFGSVADVGIGMQNKPPRIAQLALDQLPVMQDGGSLPGTGPQSMLSETRHVNVSGRDDFKITLDAAAMGKELARNNSGVKEIMALGAGRLQQKLDRHLQPEYGTIKLQQEVMAYYASNQRMVENLMAQSAQAPATELNIQRHNLLFTSLAGQKNSFSAVG